MSAPFSPDARLAVPKQLRLRAEQLLKGNSIQSSMSSPLSPDVLAFLYQIASSPEGSSDALKLLHEFQVHQVELDLQFKQLETNEQELNKIVTYYRSLFALAPAAYLVTSLSGQIIEGNKAAADLLGIDQLALDDFSIVNLVDIQAKPQLQQQLQTLLEGAVRVQCELIVNCQQRGMQPMLMVANLGLDGASVQMVLFEGVSAIA
ncbi:hypothetical protein tinsulaeT_28140 [Thalassotalea insulae]|uniref:PAS domain-containing protein n=1 Tax=Thalassotalea insulae TaxID=2056778 RepID=A0ABQ6GVV6_9GAMM|nr:PAS domain-containing protein [Thalassotalea insulae]GLX79474.1 hypothetical protein tinsulaeT_28140 [Thalassotalea insulae]